MASLLCAKVHCHDFLPSSPHLLSAYVVDLKNEKVAGDCQNDLFKLFLHPNQVPQISSQMFWKYHNSFFPVETEEKVAISGSNSAASAPSKPAFQAVGSYFFGCKSSPEKRFQI